jgi:hypothetical protein
VALYPRATYPQTDVWAFFSHSYGDGTAGSFDQSGRIDSYFRQAMDIEYTNWRKFSKAASRLTIEGASAGGFGTFLRQTSGGKFPGKVYPYASEGGGLVIVHGINDIGTLGGATTQITTAFGEALRMCISRWRASTIKEETDASVAFGGTWTLDTGMVDRASGSGVRYHNTTAGTVTITLPSDYKGEVVGVSFTGRNGANGGTVTFTGTSGTTGTLITNNVMPSGSLSACGMVKRFTNLTSANAGQTIICTVTANSGLVYFDDWWLEAKSPGPVIIANVPRLPSGQYTVNYPSWTFQTASFDGDVAALNAVITSVCGEFDAMVQIADFDGKLAADATLFKDGLHPNETGAALCADALREAVLRLTPNGAFGLTAQFNPSAAKAAPVRRPTVAGQWYSTDFLSAGAVTVGTAPTAGDMYAYPFPITEARTTWDLWGTELAAVGTAYTTNLRFGFFSDYNMTGYPDLNLQEITAGGVLAVTTAGGVGLKSSNGGGFVWKPDPGLYWLVFKFDAVSGTTPMTFSFITGPGRYMPQVANTGLVSTVIGRAVGWKLTGQAAGAFPSTFPSGATLTNTGPYLGMRRA